MVITFGSNVVTNKIEFKRVQLLFWYEQALCFQYPLVFMIYSKIVLLQAVAYNYIQMQTYTDADIYRYSKLHMKYVYKTMN